MMIIHKYHCEITGDGIEFNWGQKYMLSKCTISGKITKENPIPVSKNQYSYVNMNTHVCSLQRLDVTCLHTGTSQNKIPHISIWKGLSMNAKEK